MDTGLEKIELRNATAKRLERVGIIAVSKDRGADLPIALDRWQRAIAYLPETEKNRRTALVSQIAAQSELIVHSRHLAERNPEAIRETQ